MDNKLSIKAFNHVALQVSDIDRSADFYANVLDLQEIQIPAFDYPVRWFSLGANRELHLIGRKENGASTGIRGNHFCLEVTDILQAEMYIKDLGIDYMPIKLRPDGVKQLFLTDPDGHYIELCEM
ncbi:VOC family protein [Emticicia sp. C21]|uniref:VOC family protein n=1 Tax=Emticicia sp. C21 TaxID=2302915 RepID=UPI000E34E85D|nr:VOC family protein [Emticicia sp. C21]RFS17980.1 glyoxalase [Emticicia sp. C21]